MALFTGCLFTVKTVIWRYCSNRLNIRKTTSATKVPVRAQGKGANCYFLPIWIRISLFWASFLFCLTKHICCLHVFTLSLNVSAFGFLLQMCFLKIRLLQDGCHRLEWGLGRKNNWGPAPPPLQEKLFFKYLSTFELANKKYIISSSSVFQIKQLAWILTRKI